MPNDDNHDYDEIEQERAQDIGVVYGDLEENLEQPDVFQNPYYGGDVKVESAHADNSNMVLDINQTEFITCTENTYYSI